MIQMQPIPIDGRTAVGITVQLPKTTLVIITTDKGYIMCGALDVQLLNDRLKDRNIVAGRALGVKTLDDLLQSPLESVTLDAEKLGIYPGIKGIDAVRKMMEWEQ